MSSQRNYSSLDNLLANIDTAVQTIFGNTVESHRPNPANQAPEASLTTAVKNETIALMRVNHTGEVCAQALYQGQALTARSPVISQQLLQSAAEENDHLAWCRSRIEELGGRVSLLNPLWYAGSFTMGVVAGAFGDAWNLGFLAETEYQVSRHLSKHLQRIPPEDVKTHLILQAMREDEEKHATVAIRSGGFELPMPVQWVMGCASGVMTRVSYWV